jgi:rieske iron-sulfur protein
MSTCRPIGMQRRTALGLAGAAIATPAQAFFGRNPTLSPRQGDLLATRPASGDPMVISPSDLRTDQPPMRAWVMDPVQRTIRDTSLFGQVLLVRLDPASLSAAEQSMAADGIVAYTAVCTHAGCVVVGWDSAARHFQCPCHGSVYDAANCGRVVAGPAPRPLPALPLRLTNTTLTVASGFTAPIGASTGRTD